MKNLKLIILTTILTSFTFATAQAAQSTFQGRLYSDGSGYQLEDSNVVIYEIFLTGDPNFQRDAQEQLRQALGAWVEITGLATPIEGLQPSDDGGYYDALVLKKFQDGALVKVLHLPQPEPCGNYNGVCHP